MDEDKPHPPSQRKLRKAKEKGEAPKSEDFVAALLLMSLYALFLVCDLFALFKKVVIIGLSSLGQNASFEEVFSRVAKPFVAPLLLIFCVFCILAIAGHLAQSGWIWCKPKNQKTKKSFLRIFSKLMLLVSSGCLLFFFLRGKYFSWNLLFHCFGAVSFIFFLYGLADVFYQRWKFYKSHRMSPQELKEDRREAEGNRLIKKRRYTQVN